MRGRKRKTGRRGSSDGYEGKKPTLERKDVLLTYGVARNVHDGGVAAGFLLGLFCGKCAIGVIIKSAKRVSGGAELRESGCGEEMKAAVA